MDEEDCKKGEDFNDPWTVWSRNKDSDEQMLDNDDTITAPVQPTAQPVTALDASEDETSSFVSDSS